VPKLLAAGWDNDPHSIAEQRTITDGRIVPVGKGCHNTAPDDQSQLAFAALPSVIGGPGSERPRYLSGTCSMGAA